MTPSIEEALNKQKEIEEAKKAEEGDKEVELEGVGLEDDETAEEESQKDEEKGTDDTSEEDGADSSDEEKKKPQRKSRAKDRIHQLLQEKKELQERLKKEAEDREALRQQYEEATTASKTAEKERLEKDLEQAQNDVAAIKQQMKRALQEDDTDEYIELNEKLNRRIVDTQVLTARKAKFSIPEKTTQDTKSEVQKTTQQAPAQLPDEMQRWISQNDWFLFPANEKEVLRKNKVIRTATILDREGYSPSDPEYYQELNKRAGLAQKDTSVVELDEDEEFVEDDADDVKEETSNKSTKTTSKKPSVSGGTQTPNNLNISTKDGKTRVRLTQDQRATARRLGLSDEQYAKTLVEYEKEQRLMK